MRDVWPVQSSVSAENGDPELEKIPTESTTKMIAVRF